MRYDLSMGYFRNEVAVNLQFNPDEIKIINNTSQVLYIRRGSQDFPTVTSFDYQAKPLQILNLPASNSEYAFYLDVTGMVDTSQTVSIIFNSFD